MRFIGSRSTSQEDKAAKEIPRFSYRKSFSCIPDSKLTTDRSWGCCYRSTQGLLAQFVLRFRRLASDQYADAFGIDTSPLSLFHDSPESPFGIHRLVQESAKFGIPVGEWARPSVVASSIKAILSTLQIGCIVTQSLSICHSEVPDTFPALLLVPGLFGLDGLDPAYPPFLMLCLCDDSCLGMVSGHRNSAYFIVGFTATHFGYFDPHTTNKAVLNENDHVSYYELPVKKLRAADLNPSIMIGFFINDRDELADLEGRLVSCLGSPISVTEPPNEDFMDQVLDIDDLPLSDS
jgi:cysteine protease ATG4